MAVKRRRGGRDRYRPAQARKRHALGVNSDRPFNDMGHIFQGAMLTGKHVVEVARDVKYSGDPRIDHRPPPFLSAI